MAIFADISENEFVRERDTSYQKAIIWSILRDIWQTVRDRSRLALLTNSKSYTGFRLILTSVTLNDLERPDDRRPTVTHVRQLSFLLRLNSDNGGRWVCGGCLLRRLGGRMSGSGLLVLSLTSVLLAVSWADAVCHGPVALSSVIKSLVALLVIVNALHCHDVAPLPPSSCIIIIVIIIISSSKHFGHLRSFHGRQFQQASIVSAS